MAFSLRLLGDLSDRVEAYVYDESIVMCLATQVIRGARDGCMSKPAVALFWGQRMPMVECASANLLSAVLPQKRLVPVLATGVLHGFPIFECGLHR